ARRARACAEVDPAGAAPERRPRVRPRGSAAAPVEAVTSAQLCKKFFMRDWLSFWNSPNRIYVNDHHRDVHYREVALEIRSLVPSPSATVLDYGCGERPVRTPSPNPAARSSPPPAHPSRLNNSLAPSAPTPTP